MGATPSIPDAADAGGDVRVTVTFGPPHARHSRTLHLPAAFKPDGAVLGWGGYGIVVAAQAAADGAELAIKHVANVSGHVGDGARIARELRVQRALGVHPQILPLRHAWYDTRRDEVYMVFPRMSCSLFAAIAGAKARRRGASGSASLLPIDAIRRVTACVVRALRYAHAAGVIHRDLKPENVLLVRGGGAVLADWGLARRLPPGHPAAPPAVMAVEPSERTVTAAGAASTASSVRMSNADTVWSFGAATASTVADADLTAAGTTAAAAATAAGSEDAVRLSTEVVTQGFRAPELLLQDDGMYGPAVDMWALGCIVVQMITGSPLFPDSDVEDVVCRQHAVLGTSTAAEYAVITNPEAVAFLRSLPRRPPLDWAFALPGVPADALSFISGLLQFHPEARMSARVAYEHPFVMPIREELNRSSLEPQLPVWGDDAVFDAGSIPDRLHAALHHPEHSAPVASSGAAVSSASSTAR